MKVSRLLEIEGLRFAIENGVDMQENHKMDNKYKPNLSLLNYENINLVRKYGMQN